MTMRIYSEFAPGVRTISQPSAAFGLTLEHLEDRLGAALSSGVALRQVFTLTSTTEAVKRQVIQADTAARNLITKVEAQSGFTLAQFQSVLVLGAEFASQFKVSLARIPDIIFPEKLRTLLQNVAEDDLLAARLASAGMRTLLNHLQTQAANRLAQFDSLDNPANRVLAAFRQAAKKFQHAAHELNETIQTISSSLDRIDGILDHLGILLAA